MVAYKIRNTILFSTSTTDFGVCGHCFKKFYSSFNFFSFNSGVWLDTFKKFITLFTVNSPLIYFAPLRMLCGTFRIIIYSSPIAELEAVKDWFICNIKSSLKIKVFFSGRDTFFSNDYTAFSVKKASEISVHEIVQSRFGVHKNTTAPRLDYLMCQAI